MSTISYAEQYQLLHDLQVFKLGGRDKRGHFLLTIRAKFFPAGEVTVEVVNKYLFDKIYPKLEKEGAFSVLYIHTDVHRSRNFPGISALRSIYDNIPPSIMVNLQTVYFLHPGLQSRLFLATLGRVMFASGGLYGKVKYVSRVEYLWEDIRRKEIEVEEYVYDHDEELEYKPTVDYGLESDHRRVYGAYGEPSVAVDSPVPMYSMRCIS